MANYTVFNIAEYSFEVFYQSVVHITDNIIVWFNKEKISYAECLIKDADAKNLGFANIKEYETTLKKVQVKCPNPKYIIITHSYWKAFVR